MWMREVGKHGGENVGNLPVAIVGTKLDQASKRQVKKAAAESWAKGRDFMGYYEVSAKEKNGYYDLLTEIVDQCKN